MSPFRRFAPSSQTIAGSDTVKDETSNGAKPIPWVTTANARQRERMPFFLSCTCAGAPPPARTDDDASAFALRSGYELRRARASDSHVLGSAWPQALDVRRWRACVPLSPPATAQPNWCAARGSRPASRTTDPSNSASACRAARRTARARAAARAADRTARRRSSDARDDSWSCRNAKSQNQWPRISVPHFAGSAGSMS